MPTQIGLQKKGNVLAHINKKFHSEELQVHVDVGLLFLLGCLCPSLCLFSCVGLPFPTDPDETQNYCWFEWAWGYS